MNLFSYIYFLFPLFIIKTEELNNTAFTSNEKKLKDYLFKNYDKQVKPQMNSSDTVQIDFSLSLVEVINIDDKSKIAELNMWVKMQWGDDQLKWNPANFNNVKEIRISDSQIWKPDIFLYNSVDPKQMSLVDACASVNVLVYFYSPNILYIPPCHFKVTFVEQLKYYPYDEIKISLKFGSWTFDSKKIYLRLGDSKNHKLDIEDYKINSDWKLINTYVMRNDVKYPCCPETYIDITGEIILQRRSHFYGITLVLNSVVTALVILFMFGIPPENIIRLTILMINLGLIILQLLFLVHHIPSLLIIPVIIKCSALLAILDVLAIGLFTVLYRLTRRRCSSNVPECFSLFILNVIGRILCINKISEPEHSDYFIYREDRFDSNAEDKMASSENAIKEIEMKNRQHWYTIAIILNRLFLIIFLFIILITLIVLCN